MNLSFNPRKSDPILTIEDTSRHNRSLPKRAPHLVHEHDFVHSAALQDTQAYRFDIRHRTLHDGHQLSNRFYC